MAEERCPTNKKPDKLDNTVRELQKQLSDMNKSMKKMGVPPATASQDPIARVTRQTKQQFDELKEGIDGLKKATGENTKGIKKETEEKKKENKQYQRRDTSTGARPKVELGKETTKDILRALQNIRSQIVVTQKKESTMSGVAADHLAGGGGLLGAAKAALDFKSKKVSGALKRKFDPLNIVNRLTGGSKLATVLAGRLMGRSEKSIRGAAGLNGGMMPGMEPQTQTASASPYTETRQAPSPVSSDKSTTLLEQMSTSLASIAARLSDVGGHLEKIEAFERESLAISKGQAEHIQEMNDASKDSAALGAARASRKSAPTQVGGKEKQPAKEEGSWLSSIAGFLAPVLLPLAAAVAPVLAALAALGTAAYLIYENFDTLKTAFSSLNEWVQDLYQTIEDTVGTIKTWFSDALTSVSDMIMETGESMIETVKGFIPGYEGPTPAEKKEKLEKVASGKGPDAERAQRKLAKDVAPEEASDSILKELAPKFSEHIKEDSSEEFEKTKEDLRKGEFDTPAIKSLSGEEAPQGSPSKLAITGALTQMVAQAYGKLYKDEKGNPLRASKDPERANRLPSLMKRASKHLADTIARPSSASGPMNMIPSRTPLAMPSSFGMPISGESLSKAADARQDVAMMGTGGGSNATIVNNNTVKNINATHNSVQGQMAPVRKEESSFMRAQNRGYAPS